MPNVLANCSNPFMTAVVIGFSCGTACSPLITIFLTTYPLGRVNNVHQSLQAFAIFWTGKMAVVSVLAFLSAISGKAIIGHNGQIFNFDPRLILDGCLILTGICMLTGMLRGMRHTIACRSCGTKCRGVESVRGRGMWPLVAMGAAYGLTPCAPVLILLIMVAMMPPVQAVGVGLVFCIANSVSPLLLLTTLAGFISQKMRFEIPRLMRFFQITVFCLFIIVGSISLLSHL